MVDGVPVQPEKKMVYVLLNKPVGYVTTVSDDKGRNTVMDLVADIPVRIYPVGRLDYDTEGLLLMTNDGALTLKLTHPRHEIGKTYHVTVRGDLNRVPELSLPMKIDGVKVTAADVHLVFQQDDHTAPKQNRTVTNANTDRQNSDNRQKQAKHCVAFAQADRQTALVLNLIAEGFGKALIHRKTDAKHRSCHKDI